MKGLVKEMSDPKLVEAARAKFTIRRLTELTVDVLYEGKWLDKFDDVIAASGYVNDWVNRLADFAASQREADVKMNYCERCPECWSFNRPDKRCRLSHRGYDETKESHQPLYPECKTCGDQWHDKRPSGQRDDAAQPYMHEDELPTATPPRGSEEMPHETQECKCRVDEITLYLVFSYDRTSHVMNLRAIDRTQERAEVHAIMVRNEGRKLGKLLRVWVEKNISDHAFGASMYEFLSGAMATSKE